MRVSEQTRLTIAKDRTISGEGRKRGKTKHKEEKSSERA